MSIYPHKRNLDALLKVGVTINILVIRTLCCVVARMRWLLTVAVIVVVVVVVVVFVVVVVVAGQSVQHLDVNADGC